MYSQSSVRIISDCSVCSEHLEVGLNYLGGEVTGNITKVENYDICKTQCAQHSCCKYWTFEKSTGECRMMSENSNQTQDENFVSGTPGCSGKQ